MSIDRFVRPEQAQRLHTAILGYINCSPETHDDCLVTLKQTLKKSSMSDMTQLSSNGYSHLHDALHIPFENQPTNPELAVKICSTLIRKIFDRCHALHESTIGSCSSDSIKTFHVLLLTPDQFANSTLHQVVRNGQLANLLAYFRELFWVIKKHYIIINDTRYIDLFVKPNNEGLTSLHLVLLKKNVALLNCYLKFLSLYVLNEDACDLLFKTRSPSGYTLLQIACFTQNLEIVKSFTQQLESSSHHNVDMMLGILSLPFRKRVTAEIFEHIRELRHRYGRLNQGIRNIENIDTPQIIQVNSSLFFTQNKRPRTAGSFANDANMMMVDALSSKLL